MTDEQRLTLEELAGAVGMTTRNVRAYQTRGLLQPPRRAGRTSVYTHEHVRRLRQVQQARARGASLTLLRTLIAEGRDLDGVWEGRGRPTHRQLVDVTDAALQHTAACLAHLDVPAGRARSRSSARPTRPTCSPASGCWSRRASRPAGRRSAGARRLRLRGGGAAASRACSTPRAPCSRLTRLVADAAEVVVGSGRRVRHGPGRRGTARGGSRLGELAGAVVAELVSSARGRPEEPAPLTAARASADLDGHELDLDRRAERQRRDADGAAGVPPGVAEDLARAARWRR